MSIPPISPIPPSAAMSPLGSSNAPMPVAEPSGGASFSDILGNAIEQLQGITDNAQSLALQGAAGQAKIADVSVASTEAQLAVDLVTATRDKAVNAFNSIMSMST
jgi:flagellar hook-basal body complex protein FliE